jgi:hypothetical protein
MGLAFVILTLGREVPPSGSCLLLEQKFVMALLLEETPS